jgi:hypothetical protein
MTQDALTIYQDFLDRTAAACMARDADAFLRLIHLPIRIDTDNGTFELTDMTMARRHFTGFSNALKAQGADSYVRIATGAQFLAPTGSRGAQGAYQFVRETRGPGLRQRDGADVARRYLGGKPHPPSRPLRGMARHPAQAGDLMMQTAKDIYQAYLDRVSRALLERDIACVIDALPSAARTGFAHLFSGLPRSRRCAVRFWALGRALTSCASMRSCGSAPRPSFCPEPATVSSGGTPATPCAARSCCPALSRAGWSSIRGPDRWQSSSIHSDIGDSHVTLVSPTHGHAMDADRDTETGRAVPGA